MERNYSLDIAKFFAIFFVICVHVQPFSDYQSQVGFWPGLSATIVTFSRFAVPLFFCISGYLFGQKVQEVQNQGKYFNKFVKKNLKMYFTWLFLYFMFDLSVILLKSYTENSSLYLNILKYSEEYSIWKVLYFGTNSTAYPLWFLPALVWSVSILFFFVKINKTGLLLVMSLGLNVLGQFGQSYSGLIRLPVDTKDAVFFGLFYTTLGFFASKHARALSNKVKIRNLHLVLMAAGLFGIQFLEKQLTVDWLGGNGGNYYMSTIPLTAVLLLLSIRNHIKTNTRCIVKIGQNASGIFVTHNLIINIVSLMVSVLKLSYIQETFIWNIVFAPAVLLLSHYFYTVIQITKK